MEKIQLELDTVATLIKLIYAFMWQEYVLTSSDIFLDPEVTTQITPDTTNPDC